MMSSLHICLLVCMMLFVKDAMALTCYECTWNDGDGLTDPCYTGTTTGEDVCNAGITKCIRKDRFRKTGDVLDRVERGCDDGSPSVSDQVVTTCTGDKCNNKVPATVSCNKCDWYRDVTSTENCRTGEDVQDQIDLCAKCSRIEQFSSGVLAAVHRACAAPSLPDECEDLGVVVDQSGWYVVRQCGCTGDKCNIDSGSDGAPYLSLTMLIVMMASFAFSQ